MLTPLAANQSNRIDIEQQGSRAPFRGRFRVENMCFPKRQLERVQVSPGSYEADSPSPLPGYA